MTDFLGPKTYIIAEAGVNHNGQMDMAYRLIDVAVEAGADAVKFQTFKLSSVVSANAPLADYQKTNTGQTGSMADMLKDLELSYDQFSILAEYARKAGITFMSTPFDVESVAFLDSLNVAYFKIPS